MGRTPARDAMADLHLPATTAAEAAHIRQHLDGMQRDMAGVKK